MSSVTDFLPRFTERKYADSRVSPPSLFLRKGGPQLRVSSPDPGRSILSTSAPRSARFCDAHGPARTRERSRTRMWESGRGMAGGIAEREPESTRLDSHHPVNSH